MPFDLDSSDLGPSNLRPSDLGLPILVHLKNALLTYLLSLLLS
jgi:hypothetical protein